MRSRPFFLLCLLTSLLMVFSVCHAHASHTAETQATSSDVGVTVEIPESAVPPPAPAPAPAPSPGGGGGIILPLRGPATIVFQGFAYPDAFLTFERNGSIIGTDRAGSDGRFSKSIRTDSGEALYGVSARDALGLRSPTSNFSLTLLPQATTTLQDIL